jgi:hypothetical protein
MHEFGIGLDCRVGCASSQRRHRQARSAVAIQEMQRTRFPSITRFMERGEAAIQLAGARLKHLVTNWHAGRYIGRLSI